MPERPSYEASSSDLAGSPQLHHAGLSGPHGDGSTLADGRTSIDRDSPKQADEMLIAYTEVLQSDVRYCANHLELVTDLCRLA